MAATTSPGWVLVSDRHIFYFTFRQAGQRSCIVDFLAM
jgi:hypothetical protein